MNLISLDANLSSIETTRTPLIKAKREEPLRRGRSVWANRKRQRRIAPRSSTFERGQFIIIRQPPTRRSISSRVPTGCPVLTRCSVGFRVPREEFLPYPRPIADRETPYLLRLPRQASTASSKGSLVDGAGDSERARACCNATGGILRRVKRKVVD